MENRPRIDHEFMGAMVVGEVTRFRVWAPHADVVYVTGTFNNWSRNANPLSHKSNGYWYAEIGGVTAGDQYKYVVVYQGKEILRNDPYARSVTSSAGNSIVYDMDFDWGKATFFAPPLNSMVIYEIHIGTFNDQKGGPPGNFNSAIEKLPYLKDLGINMIEVMPSMEFAGGFSWGYNPANLFAIESDYGGPTAFKTFIKEAHKLGMGIILDVVYNHFGPSDLDLWQFDGWQENDKGGIYFFNDQRSKTPWGNTRPDYGRAEVRQYIRDNVMMWLKEYRIDGLRWDMTAFIRNVNGNDNDPGGDIPEGWGLMRDINYEIKQKTPHKIIIAEDLKNNPFITKPDTEGGAGFIAQWDAAFVHSIREAMVSSDDQARDMDAISKAIAHRYDGDAFRRIIYTESHDEVANGKARLPQDISPNDAASWSAKKRSTLGAVLVFTTPGIPMIFQGQEFLEDEWFRDQDPLDWSKKDRFSGILKMYTDLIGLRLNQHGNTEGLCSQNLDVFHVDHIDKLIAFHRWDQGGPGDSVIVAVNMTNKKLAKYPITFPRPGTWLVRFNSDSSLYDADFSNYGVAEIITDRHEADENAYVGMIDIGPYSGMIISQDM